MYRVARNDQRYTLYVTRAPMRNPLNLPALLREALQAGIGIMLRLFCHPGPRSGISLSRHCEERSDEAIPTGFATSLWLVAIGLWLLANSYQLLAKLIHTIYIHQHP